MAPHVTTIRFDVSTWEAIVAEAQRLGVANAEVIRSAVLLHLGHQRAAGRIGELEQRVGELAGRVERIARVVSRLARAFGQPPKTAVGSDHG